jgi:glycosyltransferase involved in cell wall biosynthesis
VRVLVDYRPALRTRSGVGEYTHQLVKALLAAFPRNAPNVPLDLALFSSSWKDRLQLSGGDLADVDTIDRRVPVRVLNYAWHRLGWPTAELLTGRSFDVTHSPHPLILPARRAAHVVTIADLNFLAHPERTRAEVRRDYPALVRSHAHRADHIIVISRFTAAEVERQLDVPSDRISVCMPGAPDWTARAAAPRDGYVLFFGTLEPRKNVGALLDAYEALAARRQQVPRLVLAGQTTMASRPWLERLARPPLSRVARHIGYVDPGKRREVYEGARLLVQPSFEEGFGMTALEAMTLGVPVVAANRGALPEVLGDAGPLVDPDAPEELASAIERLLDDPAFAGACASKGALRSRQFRWDVTAHRVYEAYQHAVVHRAHKEAGEDRN